MQAGVVPTTPSPRLTKLTNTRTRLQLHQPKFLACPITLQQLESFPWEATDISRGNMDAEQARLKDVPEELREAFRLLSERAMRNLS